MNRGRGAALAVVLAATLVVVLSSALPSAASGAAPAGGSPVAMGTAPAGDGRVQVAPAYVPGSAVVAVGPEPANASLSVDVGLLSQDPRGLAAYVNASEVPGTPAFRHFLGPSQAASEFGGAASAVAAAQGYFESYGLATSAHPDGLLLDVSGPASAMSRAFGTTFEEYRTTAGAEFFEHTTAATLPPVAPWTGVYGLGNATGFVPATSPPVATVPGVGGSCPAGTAGLTPCDIATAYDAAGLEANGTNGTGERIAVVDAYSSKAKATSLASDYASFSSTFGLSTGGLSFHYPVRTTRNLNASGTNPVWHYEDALDIEWTHAAAPGAAIEMVFSPNGGAGLYYAIDWIVAGKTANVISMSWGEPEVGVFNASYQACTSSCNASTDGSLQILGPVLELAAAEGISAFAASGDCGADGGTNGLAVSYPASSPYVTGVGGTALDTTSGGVYVTETGWTGNTPGSPAPGCTNQGGSGGGFSVLPRPAWQAGTGTVATDGRGVPDVAADAQTPAAFWIGGGLTGVGGTSLATPIWAGFAAIADQYAAGDLGLLNPSFYRILAGADYARDFHDITSGKNGYSAGTGWDPVTGVGTPIVAPLVADLSAGPTTVSSLASSVYASPRFGPAPLTVSFVTAAKGGSGSFALEGVAFGDGTAATAVGGKATHTFRTPGVYAVQSYVIDSTGATAASPPVVVVAGGGRNLTVTLQASAATVGVGANVTFTATVAGGTAPYLYNFSFGDGLSLVNRTTPTVVQPYEVAGGFCAEVVVRDAARPIDGGASARVPVAVGGAAAPSCGNPTSPLVLTPTVPAVRDAPADFPDLFVASGGVTAPGGLAAQVGVASRDRYTAACACAILRTPGAYAIQEWENDTVNSGAHATTNVTVAPPLNATFRASTLAGPAPLAVTFSATAGGGYFATAADVRWSFGNGDHATGASVQMTYDTPGEYLVIGSLSDRGFGNASEAFVLDVERSGGSAIGITATVTPAVNVSSGTTVDWNATPVGPASALAGLTVRWELGNGAVAYGRLANESYYASFDRLTGDVLPASVGLVTSYLEVAESVPLALPGFFATEAGGFVPSADALRLDTSVTPSGGVIPLMIDGSASASGPGGAAIGWLFGDTTSGTGPSVTHVYYGAGTYTVVTKSYDAFNDYAQRLQGVVANLTLALTGCAPSTVRGTTGLSLHLAPRAVGGAGPPYTFLWSLPNGTTSQATNVTVGFPTVGTYSISVVVSDAADATTECEWTVLVSAPPSVPALDVVLVGLAAGLALAGVFLYATRPRAR